MAGYSFGSTWDHRNEFRRFTDFDELPNWLEALNDGATGTNTLNDAKNGTYSIVTAAADNDYHWLASKSEVWQVQAGKPIRFAAYVKLTEANTDDANIVIGLTDIVATGMLQADGAGPAASFDGAVFYKVDGGTVWACKTSNAATQSTTASASPFTSAAWTLLEIEVQTSGSSDTIAQVVYLINGVKVATHALTISGMDEMHMICGCKAGAANAETLIVDWIGVSQYR